tara:strand:+ start:1493 stop:1690 length:198 start_codon:yes stop_codon:yes gene_type:complete
MKKLLFLPVIMFLASCSQFPDNPTFSLGKKCYVKEDKKSMVWSGVWFYDYKKGLSATKEACEDFK